MQLHHFRVFPIHVSPKPFFPSGPKLSQTSTNSTDKTNCLILLAPTTTATTTTDPVVLSETALMVYEDKENEKTGVDSSIRLVRRDLEDKLDFGVKQNASGEFFITDLSIADTLKGQVKEGQKKASLS